MTPTACVVVNEGCFTLIIVVSSYMNVEWIYRARLWLSHQTREMVWKWQVLWRATCISIVCLSMLLFRLWNWWFCICCPSANGVVFYIEDHIFRHVCAYQKQSKGIEKEECGQALWSNCWPRSWLDIHVLQSMEEVCHVLLSHWLGLPCGKHVFELKVSNHVAIYNTPNMQGQYHVSSNVVCSTMLVSGLHSSLPYTTLCDNQSACDIAEVYSVKNGYVIRYACVIWLFLLIGHPCLIGVRLDENQRITIMKTHLKKQTGLSLQILLITSHLLAHNMRRTYVFHNITPTLGCCTTWLTKLIA